MGVERFARLSGNGLHTATRTYNKGDRNVRLVSSVHVGDKRYYDTLMRDLSGCDRVLYERVRSVEVPQPYRTLSFVYHCYNLLDSLFDSATKTFDLQYQTKFINPDVNWENADINIREMAEAGGIFSKTNMNAIGEFLRMCLAISYMRVLKDPEAKREFLQAACKSITNGGHHSPGLFTVRDLGESVAMHKIGESSKTCGSLGVLYGSGHMDTIENFVTHDLGYIPVDVKWRRAFDMN